MVFEELEVLREDWKTFLHRNRAILSSDEGGVIIRRDMESQYPKNAMCADSDAAGEYDTVWEQLMIYFVFTYFCGAVYDGNAYGKMKFSLFGTLMIREISRAIGIEKQDKTTLADVEETARRYAREIEHSDFNKKKLEEMLNNEIRFGMETFLLML